MDDTMTGPHSRHLQAVIAHTAVLIGAAAVVEILQTVASAMDAGITFEGDTRSPVTPCTRRHAWRTSFFIR